MALNPYPGPMVLFSPAPRKNREERNTPTAIDYPDSVSGSNLDSYTYDRLGSKATSTDPRGVVHTYAYDSAARSLSDAVTTWPANVDSSVLRIQRTYE